MRYACIFFITILGITFNTKAQDEGSVVIKERFVRDKSFYFSVGPSFTLGENLGDYSTGLSFEGGFLKKSNKLVSWGANISYLGFLYDESKTYKYYYDSDTDDAIEAFYEGGNVSLISAGFNLKLNFIPVGDNTPVSVYGILNPFVSYVMRGELTATGEFYYDEDGDGVYQDYDGVVTYTADNYPALGSDNKVSGGAHLGLGIDIIPSKKVSFFLQATFSYTLPVSYVSTSSYLKDEDRYFDANGTVYYDAYESFYKDEFPIIEKGFSAISIKGGVSFNF